MQSALRKMGNSTGLIVPRALLAEIGVSTGAKMDLRIEEGRLVATPLETSLRTGWAEAARQIADERTAEEEDWLGFGNVGDADLTW